ncbi:IS21 family transposase [Roseibium sp.]|uniref:IS21 family transposase n=1 Tax=Roseibium sp. TaxID=1936156 RepID=UPI003B51453A
MVELRRIVLIHDLRRKGLSISAIARQTDLDRKTVRKYLERGLEGPSYGPRAPRPRLLEPYEDYLSERVQACPGLSVRRLLREVRDLGYIGGYTILTDFLRTIRPRSPRPFERRFETAPGEQAQVDFAEFVTEFTDEPGVCRKVWLFSFVLGNSRWLWGRFCSNQKLETVLRCHVLAFEACGGATQQILYDRMKTAVLGEAEDGTVTYNPALVALLDHYGSAPEACKAYRAKTKGKVERPFRYIRQDFFLDRTFRNLDDLNAQFTQWRVEIANVRVHATTNRVVDEAFVEEEPHLIELPTHAYNAVLTVERRVSHDGMVSVAGNLYSVPDTTRKRVLEVQHHPQEVRIFEDGDLIAAHSVLEGRNQRRIDPSHRKVPPHTRRIGGRPDKLASPLEARVTQRPLSYYDAVARRMATQETRP